MELYEWGQQQNQKKKKKKKFVFKVSRLRMDAVHCSCGGRRDELFLYVEIAHLLYPCGLTFTFFFFKRRRSFSSLPKSSPQQQQQQLWAFFLENNKNFQARPDALINSAPYKSRRWTLEAIWQPALYSTRPLDAFSLLCVYVF